MSEYKELADYILKFRGKHSIREAASIAGISHSYWSDLERGYSRATRKPVKPSMETLSKVAYALGEFNQENFKPHVFMMDLMDLAGYSLDDLINLHENDEYTLITENRKDSSSLETEKFNFPINDISYHLNDDHLNKKFYNGVPLSSSELKRINSIIELFLESTFRIPIESYNKLISLVGKKSLDELLKVYNILKLAFMNKDQITSFDDFVLSALQTELEIEDIDISHAYQVAEELFNEKKQD